MNFSAWIGGLGGLLVLLAAGAAVVAVLKANYAKATIEILKESNEALTHRVEELEAEDGRKTAAIRRIGDENTMLKEMVHGHAELKELGDRLSELERAEQGRYDDLKRLLSDIVKLMRNRKEGRE